MLGQSPVHHANDVRSNPVHRPSVSRKSSVDDHNIPFRNNHSRFIFQRWRSAANKIKQALASRRDIGAVLNVVRRPIALCRSVVPLIEQRVECFKHERFIFRFDRVIHFGPSVAFDDVRKIAMLARDISSNIIPPEPICRASRMQFALVRLMKFCFRDESRLLSLITSISGRATANFHLQPIKQISGRLYKTDHSALFENIRMAR